MDAPVSHLSSSSSSPSSSSSSLKQKLDLSDKKGLIMGIANQHSIAFGCARALNELGAESIVTYGAPQAEPYVLPLASELSRSQLLLCDVRDEQQVDSIFERINAEWGHLDFLIHSIASAPKEDLQRPLLDSSREGFLEAVDISCHSFIRVARRAAPLMHKGGCLLAMSYYGAEKVVDNYNLMGPVKAALESSVRYLAAELGPRDIRVHALSPGPIKTRAASGLNDFDQLLERAAARAPDRQLVTIDDVGAVAAGLISDATAALTGHVVYVDGGYHILG